MDVERLQLMPSGIVLSCGAIERRWIPRIRHIYYYFPPALPFCAPATGLSSSFLFNCNQLTNTTSAVLLDCPTLNMALALHFDFGIGSLVDVNQYWSRTFGIASTSRVVIIEVVTTNAHDYGEASQLFDSQHDIV